MNSSVLLFLVYSIVYLLQFVILCRNCLSHVLVLGGEILLNLDNMV